MVLDVAGFVCRGLLRHGRRCPRQGRDLLFRLLAPAVSRSRRIVVDLGRGLVLMLLVACSRLQQTPFLVRAFGPEAVELREAYASGPGDSTFEHADFTALLERHVRGVDVDYVGLQRDADRLDEYLARLAEAPLPALNRDQKLALYINAYNAFTLALILEHWPLDSIRDIPRRDRWDAVRWVIGGRVLSLAQIEHGELRPNFVEPRIHFAINCASIGCPPLRNEAYEASTLDAQLEQQTQALHDDARWVRVDDETGTVELTSLYLWYEGDFAQVAGSPLEFAARYRPELAAGRYRIRWLSYDWGLNVASTQAD